MAAIRHSEGFNRGLNTILTAISLTVSLMKILYIFTQATFERENLLMMQTLEADFQSKGAEIRAHTSKVIIGEPDSSPNLATILDTNLHWNI